MTVGRDRLYDCGRDRRDCGETQTMLVWGDTDYVIVGRDRLYDCGERQTM